MTAILKPGALILFQGDSITDCGRSYDNDLILGSGYVNLTAAWLSALHPDLNLTFINRGISGNRVYDLEARWTQDCISHQPDTVSIMIGINDTWRRYDSSILSPIDEFEACYRRILDRVKEETNAEIVLLEPFVLHTSADRIAWREDLDPRIEAVGRLAQDYKAKLVPLDGIFQAAAKHREPEFWAGDGVHPTQLGHALITQAWMKAVLQTGAGG